MVDGGGLRAAAWEADVTDEVALRAAIEGIVERFGGIDVVVANAGVCEADLVRSSRPARCLRAETSHRLAVPLSTTAPRQARAHRETRRASRPPPTRAAAAMTAR